MPNFLSFRIQNFKGIQSVEIDIKNKTLMSIVGINESGKIL
jgi:AAA15 family ATPase/GTPase